MSLTQGRYTARHDRVIKYWLDSVLDKNIKIYADTDGFRTSGGTVPASILVTEQRPDLVIHSNTGITLVELTVPFDSPSGIQAARSRKTSRYETLQSDIEESGIPCEMIIVEVGAQGFITRENKLSLTFLARKLGVTKVSNFISMTSRSALEGSRIIFNARNSPEW